MMKRQKSVPLVHVTDIANSKDMQPVQPRNIQFPGTLYGTNYRYFNAKDGT